jgi:heptosyltransferase II
MNSIGYLRKIDKIVGDVLCVVIYVFFLPLRKKRFNKVKKILVVKLWAIGESVLTLPMIQKLSEGFESSAEIDVLVRNQNIDVFTGQPFISKIILFERGSIIKIVRLFRSYDIVIDAEPFFRISSIVSRWLGKTTIGFDHGVRSILYDQAVHYNDQQHVVRTYLDLLKKVRLDISDVLLVSLKYSREDEERINDLLLRNNFFSDDNIICLSPGSSISAQGRRWPLHRFIELSKRLSDAGYLILLIGDEKDNIIINKTDLSGIHTLNLAGKVSLKELFFLIRKCTLFIGNDSGPMHIAAAQGIKTIGLFGPNTPVRFAPYGKNNRFIYKQRSTPLINVHKGEVPDDIPPQLMESISVDEVYNLALLVLGK